MKRNVRILLCGYYFQGNTGDDLMMESIVRSLSKYGEIKATGSFNPEEIDWCDILIIGGGTHIRSWNIGGYEQAKYAKEKGKKVIYYAQTIEDGHPLFEEHLKRADFITVRDSESKMVVERHGFRAILASDPVFVKKRRIIAFSLRKWVTEPQDFTERFASVLDNLSKDYDIVSIPYTPNKTDTESDISFHDKVIEQMKYKPKHIGYDEIINSIDLLISMRLHATINAVNAGKKVLAIDYDSKVGRILSDLDLKDMVVSYNDVEKISDIIRNKIFRVDGLAQREKVNEALIAKICADIKGEPSPKVSVVMYTRNRAEYLKKAIDSIIDQTIQDWELIIIDDGSTDDTGEQVQSCDDKRIRYYNFGYNGVGFSRNIGNLLSRGEIILVEDSDYINLPNRLEVTCKEMEQNRVDIIYSSMFCLNSDREKKIMSGQPFLYEKLRKSNFLYHPTVAYRLEVAMKCPYNEASEVLEDYHMYLRAADMGYKFHYIKEPLVVHQINDGQLLSLQSSEILEAEKVVGTSCKYNTPMVSIIIPTCDRPGFLKEALQSVISQTYKNFEIIVINDGGEDVLEIINSLGNKGNIIYLRHEDRRGPSAARNTGLKVARGKYIAYLDDDDIYYPNHLETLIVFLERSNCKVAYTDSYQAFQTWITDRYVTTDKKITYSYDFDRQEFLISNYIHIINIVHRRELVDEIGLFDEGLETHEDWDMCIRLSQKYDFYHIKAVTAEFRTRDDMSSATSIKRADFLRTLKLIHKRYSQFVTDPNILEAQKKLEKSLAMEVEIRQASSSISQYENLHRYRFAKEFVKGKKVLDLGCGEGYGSFMLSEEADEVTGMGISGAAVKRASLRYISENLRFIKGSITDIPIEGEKIFNVIVCFEALEHIEEHEELIKEVKRLLKEDGTFIVSTPNKYIYSDQPNYQNPFHLINKFSFDEFKTLLNNNFKNTLIYGQKVYPSSNIFPLFDAPGRQRDYAIQKGENEFLFVPSMKKSARYFIAIASDGDLKKEAVMGNSYLVDISEVLIRAKDIHIGNLEATVRERDVHIGNLEATVRDKDTHIQNLGNAVREKDTYIGKLETAMREKEAHIQHIYSGHGWKALMVYYRLRDKISPVNSRRRLFAKIVFNAILNPRGIFKNLNKKNLKKIAYHFKATELSVLEEKIERKLTQESQYEQYLQSLEKLEDSKDIKRQKAAAFQYRPKISVIVPVYNTDEKWLKLCIESVISQVYDNWELCIVDGGSTKPHIKEILKEHAEKDNRIKVKFLPQNRGIAGNTNDALGLAAGEFVGFLDHDDILTPNALYEVVKAINENPYADFIYSDEIRIDSTGNMISIAFRPDFSEYYYLSHPYIVHLTVFRKRLIDKIGGLNEVDFNSNISQDIDLVLRVISNTETGRIIHIPKPLYKWRIADQSAGHIYKNKVHEFTKKAIKMFLERKAVDGYVENGMYFNTFRVRFNLKERKKVSIIIPTKDNYTLLKQAISSIEEKTDHKNYEVLIVCNNTTDDAAKTFIRSLKKDNKYKILEYNKPFNYSAINNFAVSHAEGEYLLFLNDDVEVINPDWLTSMVEIAQDPRVGIIGAKLIYPDGRIQHAGVVLGLMNGIAEHTHKFMYAHLDKKKTIYEAGYEGSLICIREYSAVTGACMLIKRKVFEEVGGFSEDLKFGFNDIDLCLKVREKGYKILFTPYAVAYHYESASRRNNNDLLYHPEDKNIFIEKWGNIIAKGDPYYNPNLSLSSYIPVPKIIKI